MLPGVGMRRSSIRQWSPLCAVFAAILSAVLCEEMAHDFNYESGSESGSTGSSESLETNSSNPPLLRSNAVAMLKAIKEHVNPSPPEPEITLGSTDDLFIDGHGGDEHNGVKGPLEISQIHHSDPEDSMGDVGIDGYDSTNDSKGGVTSAGADLSVFSASWNLNHKMPHHAELLGFFRGVDNKDVVIVAFQECMEGCLPVLFQSEKALYDDYIRKWNTRRGFKWSQCGDAVDPLTCAMDNVLASKGYYKVGMEMKGCCRVPYRRLGHIVKFHGYTRVDVYVRNELLPKFKGKVDTYESVALYKEAGFIQGHGMALETSKKCPGNELEKGLRHEGTPIKNLHPATRATILNTELVATYSPVSEPGEHAGPVPMFKRAAKAAAGLMLNLPSIDGVLCFVSAHLPSTPKAGNSGYESFRKRNDAVQAIMDEMIGPNGAFKGKCDFVLFQGDLNYRLNFRLGGNKMAWEEKGIEPTADTPVEIHEFRKFVLESILDKTYGKVYDDHDELHLMMKFSSHAETNPFNGWTIVPFNKQPPTFCRFTDPALCIPAVVNPSRVARAVQPYYANDYARLATCFQHGTRLSAPYLHGHILPAWTDRFLYRSYRDDLRVAHGDPRQCINCFLSDHTPVSVDVHMSGIVVREDVEVELPSRPDNPAPSAGVPSSES